MTKIFEELLKLGNRAIKTQEYSTIYINKIKIIFDLYNVKLII